MPQAKHNQTFLLTIAAAIIAGLVVVAAMHIYLATKIATHGDRNHLLLQQAHALRGEVSSLKQFNDQKNQQLVSVRSLLHHPKDRVDMFTIVKELLNLVPDNVQIIKIKKHNEKVLLAGSAQTSEMISELMDRIAVSKIVQTPVVKEVVVDNKNYARRYFELIISRRDQSLLSHRRHRKLRR